MDEFSALADPTRRSILELLAKEGPLTATQICERFDVSPPAISQHLKALREAQLVWMEKKAQQRIYHINPAAMRQVQTWASQIALLWDQRFDALERLVMAEKMKSSLKNEKG